MTGLHKMITHRHLTQRWMGVAPKNCKIWNTYSWNISIDRFFSRSMQGVFWDSSVQKDELQFPTRLFKQLLQVIFEVVALPLKKGNLLKSKIKHFIWLNHIKSNNDNNLCGQENENVAEITATVEDTVDRHSGIFEKTSSNNRFTEFFAFPIFA